ncbi:bifunctional nuclease family protein [Candidatus Poribacteria bacterium]|nr:bifunctional nuclease family protein [Candidatus Poribacteria bacterium]
MKIYLAGILIVIIAITGCSQKETQNLTVINKKSEENYEVSVKGIIMDYVTDSGITPIVVLSRKENQDQILPIWIGMAEGMAINMALNNYKPKRPGTHDMFSSILTEFDMQMMKVVISDLREKTYIATITMESHGETKEIDARPSDAIALALRSSAPVFVSQKVIDKSGWVELDKESEDKVETKKKWPGNPDDLL